MNMSHSTHPAVVRRKQRKGVWSKGIGTVLAMILVVGGSAWFFLGQNAQAETTAGDGSTVAAVIVERGDITQMGSGTGTLETSQAVNMSFSTGGKVAELNVKLGDTVKVGDVLARLEIAYALEANLASAQAGLLQAQQSLEALHKKAGTTLAKAYQDLVNAQAAYDDALTASEKVNLTRCSTEVLNKNRTLVNQASEKLYALYEVYPTSVETTIARYDYDTALANYLYCLSYTDTEKLSKQSTLTVAETNLEEAQANYDMLKEASGIDPDALSMQETKIEAAQTLVTTAQEALDGTTLKAEINGKITYLAAGVGTIVDSSTFLTISDFSSPVVTFTVDEADMDKLVEGNAAEVVFTALPDRILTGVVSLANPEMISFGPFRAATGVITLDEESVKAIEGMPLGLSSTAYITGQEARDVLRLPAEALKQRSTGEYIVLLVGSDGNTTERIVTVGIKNESYVEITGGLEEGDTVGYTMKTASSSNQVGGFFFGGGMPIP